jgi:plastocyanin
MMSYDLGFWKARGRALLLIGDQKELFEVIRPETNADLVETHDRLLAKRAAFTRRLTFGAALATLTAVLAVPGLAPAATRSNTLIGTDGPGFTITMSKKTVKAGTYTIVINDRSNIHNFRLTGPGVNKLTSVPWVGKKTWTVKLKKGIYRFVCDPHPTSMKGVLRVT